MMCRASAYVDFNHGEHGEHGETRSFYLFLRETPWFFFLKGLMHTILIIPKITNTKNMRWLCNTPLLFVNSQAAYAEN